ncbi:MAG TPA: hypothetical protein ENI55_02400 [Alphaproteobacteria bacterium]|nr:hypothetical protein [Alphaproteobacteria bacterium]
MIRTTTLLFLLLAAALSLALFTVKYRVQDMEGEISGLNRAITKDRKAIHVLRAEWSYLNNPDRLGESARRDLGMTPVGAEQIGKIADIPERRDLPSRQARFPAPIGAAPVSMKTVSGDGGQ